MSYYGRQAIRAIEAGEKEIEFWLRYARRLTREERQRIARGDYASIVRPLEPEWQVGDWLRAASNLRIQVAGMRWRRDQYRTSFHIQDFRARMPRRVPPMFEAPELDAQGYPIEHDKEAIAAATEDGNYTPAVELAVSDIGDAVPPEYDNVIEMGKRERAAELQRREHAEATRKRELRALTSAMKETAVMLSRQGLDTTPLMADLQRVLAEHQEQVRSAA